MSLDTALDRYFDAWNARDGDAVAASLVEGGVYEDPTSGGPVSGPALAGYVNGLVAGFPDLQFDAVSRPATGPTSAAVQWLMRGTNTAPLPAGPATNGTVALPGADFITYDSDADKVASVQGYFDTAIMLKQLGLQAQITPGDMEPIAKFGYGVRINTDRQTIPGAVSITGSRSTRTASRRSSTPRPPS